MWVFSIQGEIQRLHTECGPLHDASNRVLTTHSRKCLDEGKPDVHKKSPQRTGQEEISVNTLQLCYLTALGFHRWRISAVGMCENKKECQKTYVGGWNLPTGLTCVLLRRPVSLPLCDCVDKALGLSSPSILDDYYCGGPEISLF